MAQAIVNDEVTRFISIAGIYYCYDLKHQSVCKNKAGKTFRNIKSCSAKQTAINGDKRINNGC